MISVLFENHHLYYLPQFIPVIDVMMKKGGFSIAASIPKTADQWEHDLFIKATSDIGIEFIDSDSEQERIRELQRREFDVVIVGNVGRLEAIVGKNTVAVMVYHGIGLKQSYYRDISGRIDIRAVESEERLEILKDNGWTNLALTGFTKLDPLFLSQKNFGDQLTQEWQFDNNKKTILYAPTFYPSSLEKLLPELTYLTDEFNVIIKLHHFSWHHSRYKSQSDYVKKFKSDRIFLVPPEKYNILPFYKIADLLISDLSSTLFEFLPLSRPIIQTNFYYKKLRHKLFSDRLTRKLDENRMEDVNFTHLLDKPKGVTDCVEKVINNPNQMEQERRKAIKRFLYKVDGKASDRLVDAIEKKLKHLT